MGFRLCRALVGSREFQSWTLMNKNMVFKKTDNVVSRSIAGETLLVPVKGKLADMQKVYVLEGSAGFIWDKLDGRRDVSAICLELTKEFDVDEMTAATDAGELLSSLEASGLVAKVDA